MSDIEVSEVTEVNSADVVHLCTMCDMELPLVMFRKDKHGIHGVGNRCKPCWKIWYAKRLESDPEYKRKLSKQRSDNHLLNRDRYNDRHKVDFQKNKRKIYERRKKFYKDNPEKALSELHRQHLRNALKSGAEAPELLGCTSEFLKMWFDLHFTINPEFSMENHGDRKSVV